MRNVFWATGGALLIGFACAPEQTPGSAAYDPARDLGQLFHDVQMAGVFEDSKTFVDAAPRVDPTDIVDAYGDGTNVDLTAFVAEHFDAPGGFGEGYQTNATHSMEEHIAALWPALTREPDPTDLMSSLLPLPNPYVVPGGRFREVYYWDSYFTMLGLIEDGRTDLVEMMLANFAYLVETVGHVPNGNRAYYLGRSQPPYFSAMVGLYATATDTASALQFLPAMLEEWDFWMDGADQVAPGEAFRRVVRVSEDVVLNRYWDDFEAPRPESYREDFELAERVAEGQRGRVYRNLRAAAESGWDFSSRWMRDSTDLITLETIDLIPVDLNSLLFHAEVTIAALLRFRGADGDEDTAASFEQAATRRASTLSAMSFDPDSGFFYDVRWASGERVLDRPTLAGAVPLYFGIATDQQAAAAAERLGRDFLGSGGFVTTLIPSGQQWDAPNGWPPLQWLTGQGLCRYGHEQLAATARGRWLDLNRRVFDETGKMTEKYDVLDPDRAAGGGEYPNQDGFGWSNGVAKAFSVMHERSPTGCQP